MDEFMFIVSITNIILVVYLIRRVRSLENEKQDIVMNNLFLRDMLEKTEKEFRQYRTDPLGWENERMVTGIIRGMEKMIYNAE